MTERSQAVELPDLVELRDGDIQIIEDLFAQPSVTTNAGDIGMLLKGQSAHTHYIKQPPWLYLEECRHPGESIIVTMSGEWVLSSGGDRQHMQPGSIFWFGGDTSAGFEVPFDSPSTILIFKHEREEDTATAFVEGLIADAAAAGHACGPDDSPTTFQALPPDHPAIEFARSVNDDLPATVG